MKPELARTLHESAKQIASAAAQLDRSTTLCDHCAAPRWANRDEYQMGIELDAIVRKLRNFAQKLGYEKGRAAQPTTGLPENQP